MKYDRIDLESGRDLLNGGSVLLDVPGALAEWGVQDAVHPHYAPEPVHPPPPHPPVLLLQCKTSSREFKVLVKNIRLDFIQLTTATRWLPAIRKEEIEEVDFNSFVPRHHFRGDQTQIYLFCDTDPIKIQGVPKKMFPCLRGYNSGKNCTTIKSNVSFKIYMQFSFWWAQTILHSDNWNLRKWSSKKATLHLKSWHNPTHFQLLLYSSL